MTGFQTIDFWHGQNQLPMTGRDSKKAGRPHHFRHELSFRDRFVSRGGMGFSRSVECTEIMEGAELILGIPARASVEVVPAIRSLSVWVSFIPAETHRSQMLYRSPCRFLMAAKAVASDRAAVGGQRSHRLVDWDLWPAMAYCPE